MRSQNRLMKGCLILIMAAFFVPMALVAPGMSQTNTYVGNDACAECHEVEYESFNKNSKKAHSGESVQIMAGDLTQDELHECYQCHVTGYGQPGGFVSFDETPALANAGCETCHGPGYDHVESGGDPELIKGKLTVKDCEFCHNAERVDAFDFKPLLYGGAH